MRTSWISALVLMTAGVSSWAMPAASDVRVHLLNDDAAIGRPYQPIGDWKAPGDLAVTLRVPLDDGSTVDAGSLRSEVQGDLIRLYFSVSKPASRGKKESDSQACKPYVPGAELVYTLDHLPHRDYRVELLGSHPMPSAPLYTLQRAWSEGLPRIFDVSVPKDGSIVLNGRTVSLDDMDLIFTRAEPYQIPVLLQSNNTAALAVHGLAEEHELPYQFPNYEKLLMRSADEVEAEVKAEDKTPHPPKGPWQPFGKHSTLPLSVSLSLPGMAMKSGTTPKFTVDVSNGGTTPIRITDFKSYPYLMSSYLLPILTQGGERVWDIPVAISDAGVSSPKELTLLPASKTLSVNYSGFPYMLDHLKHGRYEATLIFYFDEMHTRRYVESKTLSFQVE